MMVLLFWITYNPIPTLTTLKGRAVTSKNYTLPEAQQQEIKIQATQMLEDDIVTPSNSGWNFTMGLIWSF
jgi:hypothetical protein